MPRASHHTVLDLAARYRSPLMHANTIKGKQAATMTKQGDDLTLGQDLVRLPLLQVFALANHSPSHRIRLLAFVVIRLGVQRISVFALQSTSRLRRNRPMLTFETEFRVYHRFPPAHSHLLTPSPYRVRTNGFRHPPQNNNLCQQSRNC
jgi:hypothetical protein